ncbi:MAG TPA: Ig-like domain-containing protein, partial [Chitinophagales bacterium]|nr:Ig-like domain-containing protein [Chitinophagales bacterium]
MIINKGAFINGISRFLHTHLRSFLYLFILSFLMNACAVISAPTGGEKDKIAPKAIKINPQNETVNFNAKEINIDFDEFIQLQNPQNILITPDINPKPVFTSNRKSLNIKFKTTLDSNTTYSIFFGSELKDYTEGNPTDNFTYVFSTGEYIDSLKIKGSIQNYEDKLPQNTYAILYKDLGDSVFTTKRPNYISRIQTDGTFEI